MAGLNLHFLTDFIVGRLNIIEVQNGVVTFIGTPSSFTLYFIQQNPLVSAFGGIMGAAVIMLAAVVSVGCSCLSFAMGRGSH